MVAKPHGRGTVVAIAATVMRPFLLPRRTLGPLFMAGLAARFTRFAMLRLTGWGGLGDMLALRTALAGRPRGPRLTLNDGRRLDLELCLGQDHRRAMGGAQLAEHVVPAGLHRCHGAVATCREDRDATGFVGRR